MHRLFVALRPPFAMRELLLDLQDGVDGARWQSDEQLHCTLRFLGDVERPVAEDLAHALQGVRAEPLMLALSGVGRFGQGPAGRALWAGIAPADGVTTLHRKVDRVAVTCGLPPERRAYLPHITIARMGARAGPAEPFLARHAGLSSPPTAIDCFYLYESHLGRDGPRYETIARYPLG